MNPDEYYFYRNMVIGFYATNPGSGQAGVVGAIGISRQAVDRITFDLWREGLLSHGENEIQELVPT